MLIMVLTYATYYILFFTGFSIITCSPTSYFFESKIPFLLNNTYNNKTPKEVMLSGTYYTWNRSIVIKELYNSTLHGELFNNEP